MIIVTEMSWFVNFQKGGERYRIEWESHEIHGNERSREVTGLGSAKYRNQIGDPFALDL